MAAAGRGRVWPLAMAASAVPITRGWWGHFPSNLIRFRGPPSFLCVSRASLIPRHETNNVGRCNFHEMFVSIPDAMPDAGREGAEIERAHGGSEPLLAMKMESLLCRRSFSSSIPSLEAKDKQEGRKPRACVLWWPTRRLVAARCPVG